MELVKQLDADVEDALKIISGTGSLPYASFSFNEISNLNLECAMRASKRIEHFFYINNESSIFYNDAIQNGAFKGLYKDVLDSIRAGKGIPNIACDLDTRDFDNKKTSKPLCAFLIDKITNGKYAIKGFNKINSSPVWLSAVFERDSGFDFIDTKGQAKKITYSKLDKLGYSPIANGSELLRKKCKDSLSSITKSDVMTGNAVVSRLMLPKARRLHSEAMLDRLIEIIKIEMPEISNKAIPAL